METLFSLGALPKIHLFDKPVDKQAVKELLGHSSVKVTEIYFNQLPKEVLKKHLTKLPKLI